MLCRLLFDGFFWNSVSEGIFRPETRIFTMFKNSQIQDGGRGLKCYVGSCSMDLWRPLTTCLLLYFCTAANLGSRGAWPSMDQVEFLSWKFTFIRQFSLYFVYGFYAPPFSRTLFSLFLPPFSFHFPPSSLLSLPNLVSFSFFPLVLSSLFFLFLFPPFFPSLLLSWRPPKAGARVRRTPCTRPKSGPVCVPHEMV